VIVREVAATVPEASGDPAARRQSPTWRACAPAQA